MMPITIPYTSTLQHTCNIYWNLQTILVIHTHRSYALINRALCTQVSLHLTTEPVSSMVYLAGLMV